jgi:hypothetical protein
MKKAHCAAMGSVTIIHQTIRKPLKLLDFWTFRHLSLGCITRRKGIKKASCTGVSNAQGFFGFMFFFAFPFACDDDQADCHFQAQGEGEGT